MPRRAVAVVVAILAAAALAFSLLPVVGLSGPPEPQGTPAAADDAATQDPDYMPQVEDLPAWDSFATPRLDETVTHIPESPDLPISAALRWDSYDDVFYRRAVDASATECAASQGYPLSSDLTVPTDVTDDQRMERVASFGLDLLADNGAVTTVEHDDEVVDIAIKELGLPARGEEFIVKYTPTDDQLAAAADRTGEVTLSNLGCLNYASTQIAGSLERYDHIEELRQKLVAAGEARDAAALESEPVVEAVEKWNRCMDDAGFADASRGLQSQAPSWTNPFDGDMATASDECDGRVNLPMTVAEAARAAEQQIADEHSSDIEEFMQLRRDVRRNIAAIMYKAAQRS